MGNQEQSQPLLSDNKDHHDIPFSTPYHDDDDSGSDTVTSTTVYTPSTTSAAESRGDDGLPKYHDVTLSFTPPKDYKGSDVAGIPVEQEQEDDDDDDDEEEEPVRRRRGCCGRTRRAKKGDKKKCRLRRRLFAFLKVFFFVSLVSVFIGKKCMRDRKARDFMWAECPQVNEESQTREIVRETGSRAIWGRYPLYDLLSLKTTSGSIVVTIEPQPADPENPDEPARLVLETVTGSVAVSFTHPQLDAVFESEAVIDGVGFNQPFVPDEGDIKAFKRSCKKLIKKKQKQQQQQHKKNKRLGHTVDKAAGIQYRPYEIVIKTDSGSVSGKLIFSSSAHVETRTGTISTSLIPIISSGDSVNNASLVTHTHSGSQHIVLANPLRVASSDDAISSLDTKLGHATSTHTSDSGHINVVYPHSWAGTVDAFAHTGSICLDGWGLEVSKDGQGHATAVKYAEANPEDPKWWGSRGDMNVSLEAKTSGSITFFVKNPSHE